MGNPRYFRCCIPVGAAVSISSFLSLICSGFSAGAYFWFVHIIDVQPDLVTSGVKITSGTRIGIIIAGVVFAIITITSLFGFTGSVIRNRRMTKAYSILVWICFLSWLPLTGFTFALAFSKGTLIRCYVDLNEIPCSLVIDAGGGVGFSTNNVIGLLIQLYTCVVVRRYVEQLEDERVNRNDFGLNRKSTSNPPFQNTESDCGSLNSKH